MSTKNRSKSKADSPNMPRKSKVQSPIIKKGKKRIHGEELKVRILEPSDDWQPIPTSPKEKRRSSKYRETTKVFELQDEEMSDDVRPEVPRSRSRSRSRESSPSDFDEPETHPEVKSSRRKRVEPPPIEVVVDRTLRTDVQYRDVYPKDEHGNEDRSAPAKRWEPIPASAEQQAKDYKRLTALLDYHQKRGEPGIPVVMIEEGNKIYHRLDMAYIVEFPERNNVGKQVYQVGNEMYDHPKPVLRAIKQYRGKKSRSTKSGEETEPNGKPWQELYIQDNKGIYRRLGTEIPYDRRPTAVPKHSSLVHGKSKAIKKPPTVDDSIDDFILWDHPAAGPKEPVCKKQKLTDENGNVNWEDLKKAVESDPNIAQEFAKVVEKLGCLDTKEIAETIEQK